MPQNFCGFRSRLLFWAHKSPVKSRVQSLFNTPDSTYSLLCWDCRYENKHSVPWTAWPGSSGEFHAPGRDGKWPEPGCSACACEHEGLLASPFEMKGKKNIGSKFFKSPLILFVFKLWTFEMWECQKCLAQAKLTHLSLAYLERFFSLSPKSNLGPRWWAVKSLGVYPCRVSSGGNCLY